jgi:osmotically-inducible protein OsmY
MEWDRESETVEHKLVRDDGKCRHGGVMKTDKQLQRDVLGELQREPSVDATKIGVIVHHGIVTLSGAVASYAERCGATNASERVAGVKAVVNKTKVELPSMHHRNDVDLAEAVVNALKWHVWVPHDTIKVKVGEGWVTLEGAVDAEFQRECADEAVRCLTGVKGLTNLITVRQSALNASKMQSKIA